MSEVEDISTLVVGSLRQPVKFDLPDGRQFMALPHQERGYTLEQITLANKADVLMPKLVTQHVKMQTAGSLTDYINRFKNNDTMLFADIDNDTIVSIVDYHHEPVTTDMLTARLGVHRATLKLPKSLEWQTWNGISGKLMSHKDFASFLEENSIDIVTPVGADLLEMCRDLQVINNSTFTGSVRDGDYTSISFQKDSDATAKGNVRLPPSIVLNIPVYFGEPPVQIVAFRRQKIDDDGLHLGVKLSRAENVRQEEFHRIVDAVTIGVDHLTTVYGTPA